MPPRISIITPSFNQSRYIEATVRSVLAQNYPDLEHIVVDGGSTDGTLQILAHYPHLKIVSERDRGQADALNKGLRLATGEIIGWLNSDDTYFPGVLHDVATLIDPAADRLMVMGRCAYIDEQGALSGAEHPSAFVSHRRVVQIWKGYSIPQPALFFHRRVYEACGGLDEALYFALDYDLFLRYTRRYPIFTVDRLWATYRLHAQAKTSEQSQAELLLRSLAVSRRYWGRPGTWQWLRYWLSFWGYGGNLHVASLGRLNRAEVAWQCRQLLSLTGNLLMALLLWPPTVVRTLLLPRLRRRFLPQAGQEAGGSR